MKHFTAPGKLSGARFLCCFFILLFCGARAFPLPDQKILYPGDSIYDALMALSLEQGLVFLTGSSMTAAQAELMFAKINDGELSPGGTVLYEELRSFFAGPSTISAYSGLFNVDFIPALQPELYYKTNKNLPWIHDRYSRQPFIILPISFSISSYVTLGTDLYLDENRILSNAHDNYFNFPFDKMIDGEQPLDINVPKRAYMSAGFPFGHGFGVNFKLGLGDEALGRTKTGSIIMSDTMRALTYGNLRLYAPFISYDASVMELEVTKYLYLHQIQLNVFDRLSFSLIEGVMVNAPFELRYINPMMIFHSFTAWDTYGGYNRELGNDDSLSSGNSRVGSYLGISLDFRPWKYGRIYGLFSMTQLELPDERTPESVVPDGLAFQLGYESWIPVSGFFFKTSTGHVSFGLEGVYTYPYMYILGGKGWSFYRESSEISNDPIREWVGTPFGPDSAAGSFWVGYHDSSRWSAELFFLFLAQGKNSSADIFYVPKGQADEAAYTSQSPAEATSLGPTGTVSRTWLIKLKGAWEVKNWLNLALQPGYKIVANNNHIPDNLQHGFEITLSARLSPEFRSLRYSKLTGSTSTSR